MKKGRWLYVVGSIIVLAALAWAVHACGSSDSGSSGGTTRNITLKGATS